MATKADAQRMTVNIAVDKEDLHPCMNCDKRVDLPLVNCTFCNGWVHQQCTNVPDKLFAELAKYDCVHVSCKKCLTAIKGHTEQLRNCATVIKTLGDAVKNVDRKLSDVLAKTASLESSVTATQQSQATYADVVQKLDHTLADMNSKNDKPACTPDVRSAVLSSLDETADRERRKQNVIVFGLPESANRSDDANSFTTVCSSELNVTIVVNNSYRLGRVGAGKPRPLVVQLGSVQERMSLLRRAKQLRNSADSVAKQMYIRPDLTRMQQAESKKLMDELRLKKASDTVNWYTIRRGRVVAAQIQQQKTYNGTVRRHCPSFRVRL